MSEDLTPPRAASFVGSRGEALPVDYHLTVDRLAGVHARATNATSGEQFFLEGVLNAEDMNDHGELLVWEELTPQGDGCFDLDLEVLAPALRRMLSTSSDLDAHVRLRVGSNREPLPPLSLLVTRFDLAFEVDGDDVVLRGAGEEVLPEPPPDPASFRVEAVPLGGLAQDESTPLARVGEESRWSFAPVGRKPGPWLILGWQGATCRVRPLQWQVDGELDGSSQGELQRMLLLAPGEERSLAAAKVFQVLAENPGAPEWEAVLACLYRLDHLPPAVLPVTVELARRPAAAAVALIAAGDDLPRVWRLLEELPFGWWQVPVRAWVRLARSWRVSIRTSRSGDLLREFLDKVSRQGRFLEPVGEWTRVEVLGESRRRTQLGMGLEIPLHVLEQERQALFDRALERWWPQGDRCLRWLKDQVGKLAGGMTPLKQVTIGVSRFKRPVLAAPMVAALSAALDLRVDQATFYQLRRLRDFDREWFDAAHMLILRIAVTVLIDENPDVLR